MEPFVPEQGQLKGTTTGTDPLYGLPDYESPTIEDKPHTLYHPSLPTVSERAEPDGSMNGKINLGENGASEYDPPSAVTSTQEKIDKMGRDMEGLKIEIAQMQGLATEMIHMKGVQRAQNRTIGKLFSRINRN